MTASPRYLLLLVSSSDEQCTGNNRQLRPVIGSELTTQCLIGGGITRHQTSGRRHPWDQLMTWYYYPHLYISRNFLKIKCTERREAHPGGCLESRSLLFWIRYILCYVGIFNNRERSWKIVFTEIFKTQFQECENFLMMMHLLLGINSLNNSNSTYHLHFTINEIGENQLTKYYVSL